MHHSSWQSVQTPTTYSFARLYATKGVQLYTHVKCHAVPRLSCGCITRVPIVKMHTHSPRDRGMMDRQTSRHTHRHTQTACARPRETERARVRPTLTLSAPCRPYRARTSHTLLHERARMLAQTPQHRETYRDSVQSPQPASTEGRRN